MNTGTSDVQELFVEMQGIATRLASMPMPKVSNRIRWLVLWTARQAADQCDTALTLIRNEQALIDSGDVPEP